jgi:NAD(P)H-dependent FMN reductase
MHTTPLKVKIILGSTRPGRFSDKLGTWVVEQIQKRSDSKDVIEAEILDLRDYLMPFFDEAVSPSAAKTPYTNPAVVEWAAKIAEADAFIVISPEYNHGYSAVLKNAFDYLGKEWNKKPIGFIAYGSVGGARSVEQLRLVAVELQMAPIRAAVHIFSPWTFLDEKGELKAGALDQYDQAAGGFLTQLIWWSNALKTAREIV